MSDLDDLAQAASGGAGKGGRQPAAPPAKLAQPAKAVAEAPPEEDERVAYERPAPASGVSPKTWVGLGLGIVAVLGLAFWLINRDKGPGESTSPLAQAIRSSAAGKGATTKAAGAVTAPTTNVSPNLKPVAGAGTTPGSAGAAPASRPGALVLKDIEDPADAIEVYRLKRDGTTLDIGVRNISKRGVYVRVLQFYPESDEDDAFGESIRFWLPPGIPLNATHEIPRLAARLGDDEGVTAFIEDAEFTDEMPDELKELAAEAEASNNASDDEGPGEEEEPAPKSKKKGKTKKKTAGSPD